MSIQEVRCPECDYVAQTGRALGAHVARKHANLLKKLPPQPTRPGGNEHTLNPRTCAIYLRVSTIDQTVEQQLPKIEAFAGLRGLEVVARFVDKSSGGNTDRPDLVRMMESVANTHPGAHPFEAVVYLRSSRLGRNLRDVLRIWDYFEERGIATISATEPFDTRTPPGRFVRTILAAADELNREQLIEQTKEKIAYNRARGQPVGSHPPGCGKRFPCPWGADHSPFGVAMRYKARGNVEKLHRLIRSGALSPDEVARVLGVRGARDRGVSDLAELAQSTPPPSAEGGG